MAVTAATRWATVSTWPPQPTWRLAGGCSSSPYQLHDQFPPGSATYAALPALPKAKLWSVMERLTIMTACHFFLACRRNRPAQVPFVQNVDGRRSIREIAAAVMDGGGPRRASQVDVEDFARRLFESLWLGGFVGMGLGR